MNILKIVILTIIISTCSLAKAGIINGTDSTFIDTATGLQWMDFGVNNIHTYNEVSNLLTTTYDGWDLASQTQVLQMWSNLMTPLSSNIDIPQSEYFIRYSSFTNNYTALTAIIGENNSGIALGWFEDDSGQLSYAYTNGSNLSQVYGKNVNFDSYRTNRSFSFSTMLVRSTNVPEPTTLAIFALGMIGLASRRFKK